MIELNKIGETLKKLRENSNATLYQVWRNTDISISTLSNYENSVTIPSLLNLILLADYYETSVTDILKEY